MLYKHHSIINAFYWATQVSTQLIVKTVCDQGKWLPLSILCKIYWRIQFYNMVDRNTRLGRFLIVFIILLVMDSVGWIIHADTLTNIQMFGKKMMEDYLSNSYQSC